MVLMLLLSTSNLRGQVTFTSSDLPIVIITTQQFIPDDPKVPGTMGIIDNGPGVRNKVTDPHNNFDGLIGIEVRGSSSQMFPKKQYGIEIRDAAGNGIDASILGMPAKDDWVLFAPYDDKSLMRDVLAYELGRELGHYASRSRYCELVLNGTYMGVYVMLEKVKRDKYRVNIAKLEPTEVSGDDLTGGYIIKIDKQTGGGTGWLSTYDPPEAASGQKVPFLYDYPKTEDIVPQQKAYIQNFMKSFEDALYSVNFKDPVQGYPHYIDAVSFADYFIVNELTKNPDAYRLSTYFYKQKDSDGGKMFMGPIWDFNLGFGNVDYCTLGTTDGLVINYNHICPKDGWLVPFWWGRLMQDPAFTKLVRTRWDSLRQGPYKTDVILSKVDSIAHLLDESEQRNFLTWPVLGQYVWPNYYVGTSFPGEVEWLKNWIRGRLEWLDVNMPSVITEVDAPDAGFSMRLYPNPFDRHFQIDYKVPDAGTVSFELIDILGHSVERVDKTHEAQGFYTLDYTVGQVPSGTFVLRARFQGRTLTSKVIKL